MTHCPSCNVAERNEGFDKGVAQGFDKGVAQGSREKAIDTARNLLAMGLSVQKVAQGVGLSLDEVEDLR